MTQQTQITLVITPIDHLPAVVAELEMFSTLKYEISGNPERVLEAAQEANYIFTNPNTKAVHLNREILSRAKNLRAICTASTGQTHIAVDDFHSAGVAILSLREEHELLEQLPSTAELALALSLTGLRRLFPAIQSTLRNQWNYLDFYGSQVKGSCVGIVGLGRLGRMYASFMSALGADVRYFDPWVENPNFAREKTLASLIRFADVLSLHAHVNASSFEMINASSLNEAKPGLILVNTARGELVNEGDIKSFLNAHPEALYLSDVLADEHLGVSATPLLSLLGKQVFLTPHVGGMTHQGQAKAFLHAASMLRIFDETYRDKSE